MQRMISMQWVPNYVRDIPIFDGDAAVLMQWISDVDGVLEVFQEFKNTHQYKMLIRCIRRKITGEANRVLISSNTLLSWRCIKETLKTHYADKRDLITLTTQLTHLTRKHESVEIFYAKVMEIQSLILNGVSIDPE